MSDRGSDQPGGWSWTLSTVHAWCLVCELCRLAVVCVDGRCFLALWIFPLAVPGVWSFLRVTLSPGHDKCTRCADAGPCRNSVRQTPYLCRLLGCGNVQPAAPRSMLWMLRLLAAAAAVVTPACCSGPITTAGARQFLAKSYPIESGVPTTTSSSSGANMWTTAVPVYSPSLHEGTGEDDGRGRSLLHKNGCHGRRCGSAGAACRAAYARPHMPFQ